MSRPWAVHYRHGKFYVAHRESRARYPADDRVHAHRLARCLNQGADFFGAKKLMQAILRDLGK